VLRASRARWGHLLVSDLSSPGHSKTCLRSDRLIHSLSHGYARQPEPAAHVGRGEPDRAHHYPAGTFGTAYCGNHDEAVEVVIDGDPVCHRVLRAFMRSTRSSRQRTRPRRRRRRCRRCGRELPRIFGRPSRGSR
jgi:hypothetical protein